MSGQGNSHDAAETHVVPYSVYFGVFFALLIGTGLTTWVAYIDLGALNTPIALLIAFVKMTLVILFFMHVKYQTGLTQIAIVTAFFWLAIMITLTLTDELTRGWEMTAKPWSPGALLPLLPHVGHLSRLLF
jgi:cytochrome c oxidase subunit 4